MENKFEKDKVVFLNALWNRVPQKYRKPIFVILFILFIFSFLLSMYENKQKNNKNSENINGPQMNVNNKTGYVNITQNYYGSDVLEKRVNKIEEKIKTVVDSKDLDTFIQAIFKNQIVESLDSSQNDRIRIIKVNENFAFVLIRLNEIPIPDTVQLQWHVFDQPAGSYSMIDNMLLFNWADDIKKLETKTFTIRYIAANPLNLPKLEFREKDGYLYIGNKLCFRLSDGTPFNINNNIKAEIK